jgi:hypothetical protein
VGGAVTRRTLLVDALACLLAFGAGTLVAREFLLSRAVVTAGFFDWELTPAVMQACGRGFSRPAQPIAALDAFITRRTDAFDCANVETTATLPPVHIAHAERYALAPLTATLRVFGITWGAIDAYLATLFGVSTALAYALLRVVSSAPLALAGALVLACSTRLEALQLFRDYIKEPPFLALLLAVALLVVRERTHRHAYGLAVLAGALLGFGIGWRMDLLVLFPFVLIAIFFFVRFTPRTRGLRARALAGLLFAVSFAAAGFPILRTMSEGSNSAHVVLLGFMASFTTELGLRVPIYDLGDTYSDGHAFTLIAAQARVREQNTGPFPFGTRVYDQAGTRLVADIARHFPADMLVRAYGAVVQSLAFPYSAQDLAGSKAMTVFSQRPWLKALAIARARAMWLFTDRGVWLTLLAILLLAAVNARLALFAAFAVIYLCGYSMLQFSRRHTFHLDFFSVAAGIALIQAAITAALAAREREWQRPAARPVFGGAVRAAVFAAGVAVVLALPLMAARMYQQRHVAVLIARPLQAARPVPSRSTALDDATVLVSSDALGVRADEDAVEDERDVRMDYVVVTVDGACAVGSMAVQLRYTGVVPTFDKEFNRTMTVAGTGLHHLLAPVFYEFGPHWTRFDGFVIDRKQAGCITQLARVDEPGQLPFPFIYANLDPDWRDAPLYQAFADHRP